MKKLIGADKRIMRRIVLDEAVHVEFLARGPGSVRNALMTLTQEDILAGLQDATEVKTALLWYFDRLTGECRATDLENEAKGEIVLSEVTLRDTEDWSIHARMMFISPFTDSKIEPFLLVTVGPHNKKACAAEVCARCAGTGCWGCNYGQVVTENAISLTRPNHPLSRMPRNESPLRSRAV